MFKLILENVEGIIYLPIFSLIFFFVFFIGVLIFAFRLNKGLENHLANLPLENNNINNYNSAGEYNG